MADEPSVSGAMHVVTNRVRHGEREYSSTLVRRSYREGGKVKKETLANLSRLPPDLIELIRGALRGQRYVAAEEAFEIERSLPAGHVAAALAMARRLELARLLGRTPSRERDLCLAMICQRALAPSSNLATARLLDRSTLSSELNVEGADEDDLHGALDWLSVRQRRIEARLARRHLEDRELALYGVSSCFGGRSCPPARPGRPRDGGRGTPQIVHGLLCDKAGRPIAVEVFSGEPHDDKTLRARVEKLKERSGLVNVVVVSDRGMVTKADHELLRETDGAGWITALKAPQIKRLVARGALQPSLLDRRDLAEITAPEDYPGERLVVCRDPLVAAERTREREERLQATERDLDEIAERVAHGALRGAADIRLAVGPAAKRYRMKKHLKLRIGKTSFSFSRKAGQIAAEAALDGIDVLRTSLAADELPPAEVVRSYRQLQQVERAFRAFDGVELEIRPVHRRLDRRLRAHVFLCMLAYYLTWHLEAAWAPLLLEDEQPPTTADPVAKAGRSRAAQRNANSTGLGEPCRSYKALLDELSTLTRHTIRLPGSDATFDKLAQPTRLQARALELADQARVTEK
jgi:hypothetical protein